MSLKILAHVEDQQHITYYLTVKYLEKWKWIIVPKINIFLYFLQILYINMNDEFISGNLPDKQWFEKHTSTDHFNIEPLHKANLIYFILDLFRITSELGLILVLSNVHKVIFFDNFWGIHSNNSLKQSIYVYCTY